MKIFFFLLLSTSVIHSQWMNQNPVPDGNTLYSTFFINDNNGWIVGSDGFIIKTTNSGIDWIPQTSGTDLNLKSVQFFNQDIGWICGEDGLILKTTDGGQNWIELTSGIPETLNDIFFYDLNTGWVVGFAGKILKTTDGGLTWTIQTSETFADLNSIDFSDENIGYAVGRDNTLLCSTAILLKTTDGGLSWIDISANLSIVAGANTIEFINSETGWIGSGENSFASYIFKTTDGGQSWIQQNLFTLRPDENINRDNPLIDGNVGIRSIYFKDANNGWAVNGNGTFCRAILTTTDGGENWDTKYFGLEEFDLLSVFVNNAGQGWAVGYNGTIFITDDNGQSWAQQFSGGVHYGGEENIHSIHFANDSLGWAAGTRKNFSGIEEYPLILKTTNGGKIWKTNYYGYYYSLRSVYFIDENIGWAGGTEKLLSTTNGGENWSYIPTDIRSISSIFFIDQNTGWLISDDSFENLLNPENINDIIAKSTDGGLTWIQKSDLGGSSIYFLDLNTGWAVGENGNIRKSTDGGETWISKLSGTSVKLNCVKFYDSNLGICVGESGTILLTTDGGENWFPKTSSSTDDLNSVTFTNPSSFWIAGSSGEIFSTTDLGSGWAFFNDMTDKNFNTIFFTNENTGWSGGLGGALFKYKSDVVPVDLISFTAKLSADQVKLEWQTSTETNNYGFEIEKRIDDGDWNNLGFVEGHNNSTSTNYYAFTDLNPIGGNILHYRLKQIDFNGEYEFSNEVTVEITPNKFALYQNYPNPFNPSTNIRFQVPEQSRVIIKIYNILGAEVSTLLDEKKEQGVFEVKFNAENLPSGTYIYRIIAADFVESKKMILIK